MGHRAALCITDKRKEVIDFSESYITIGATVDDSGQQSETSDHFRNYSTDPDVIFAVPTGSWSELVAKEVAPQSHHEGTCPVDTRPTSSRKSYPAVRMQSSLIRQSRLRSL